MKILERHKSILLILWRTKKNNFKSPKSPHNLLNKMSSPALAIIKNTFLARLKLPAENSLSFSSDKKLKELKWHASLFPLYAPFCSIWSCLIVNEKLKTLAPASALSSPTAFSLQWLHKICWPKLETNPFHCWALESRMSSLLSP